MIFIDIENNYHYVAGAVNMISKSRIFQGILMEPAHNPKSCRK